MSTFSKPVWVAVVALAVVSLVAGALHAQERQREQQRRQGFGGAGANLTFLLRQQQVQQELKVTDEQKETLQKVLDDQAAAQRKLQDEQPQRQLQRFNARHRFNVGGLGCRADLNLRTFYRGFISVIFNLRGIILFIDHYGNLHS